MTKLKKHKPFCFGGQPAPCPGYFPNDTLPCVCDKDGSVLSALSQVLMPAKPIPDKTPAVVYTLALSA